MSPNLAGNDDGEGLVVKYVCIMNLRIETLFLGCFMDCFNVNWV